MKTSLLLYGQPAEVANELCSCNEPEDVGHVDLIAALGNALNRIAKLEHQLNNRITVTVGYAGDKQVCAHMRDRIAEALAKIVEEEGGVP